MTLFNATRKTLATCLQNPFRQPKQLDSTQKALANLPGAAFYAAALLLVTAAGALGFTAGSKAPGVSRQRMQHLHAVHCTHQMPSQGLC